MPRPDDIANDAPEPGEGQSARSSIAQAGGAYGGVMLLVTLLFAPLRKSVESLGIDPLIATLSQAVGTLFALILVAGWVVQVFNVPRRVRARLAVGGLALVVLVVGASAWEILLFGASPSDLIQGFAGVHGPILGTAMLISALMPAVRGTG